MNSGHAIKIIEALDNWYRQSSEGPSASALLFEDEKTLSQHIRLEMLRINRIRDHKIAIKPRPTIQNCK